MRIIVQKKAQKEGVSASNKAYTKYGIQDSNGTWYNSFQFINAVEGGEYDIEFTPGKFGNDLKSCVAVDKTTNQLNNNNRNDSIVRQHSQDMALRYFQVKGIKDFSDDDLIERINFFVEDVKGTENPF